MSQGGDPWYYVSLRKAPYTMDHWDKSKRQQYVLKIFFNLTKYEHYLLK